VKSRHFLVVVVLGYAVVLFGACSQRDADDRRKGIPPSTVGSGPGTTTGGGMMELNACSCLLTVGTEMDPFLCDNCWEDSYGPGKECEDLQRECQNDAACKAVATCVAECNPDNTLPADVVAACIGDCAFPPDKDAGTMLYHERINCFCSYCGDTCNAYEEDAFCPVSEGGSGGIGGAGGLGGAGGAGAPADSGALAETDSKTPTSRRMSVFALPFVSWS
jgi:hypothetical protein